jgi:hypothetical protein
MIDLLLADDTFTVIDVNLDYPGATPRQEHLPSMQRIQSRPAPVALGGHQPSRLKLLQAQEGRFCPRHAGFNREPPKSE